MRCFILLWAVPALAGPACGQDPWEVNPYHEEIIVSAGWGSGPGQFTPLRYWGEGEIEDGPGPFAVDENGYLYVMDPWSNQIEIFDSFEYVRTIELPEQVAWAARDLAVKDGIAVWLAGNTKLRYLDLMGPDSGVVTVESPYDRTECQETVNVGRLFGSPDGIVYYNTFSGVTDLIVSGTQLLSRGARRSHRKIGLLIKPGLRVARLRSPSMTEDGRRALGGDLVVVDAAGAVQRVLVENVGYPLGCDSAGNFLVEDTEEVAGRRGYYLEVHAPEGPLLSRTRQASRPFVGRVNLGPRYRMGEDCYYEIHISREHVFISRWRS